MKEIFPKTLIYKIFFQVFRNGRRFDFKGRRDLEGIIEYMKEQAKLPSMEIKSVLEMQNNMARTDATIIGYFTEMGDMFEEYIGAANELRGMVSSFFSTQYFKDIMEWLLKI